MNDTSWVWKRVEHLERTDDLEAAQLLKGLLENLKEARGGPGQGFLEVVQIVASAMHRVDHRKDGREDLYAELEADSRHHEALNRFLIRMISSAEQSGGFADTESALQALDSVIAALTAEPARPVPKPNAPGKPAPAAKPVPKELSGRQRKLALAGFFALPVVLVLLLVFKIVSENRQARTPHADERISGTRVDYLTVEQENGRYRMVAEWADGGRAASSNGGCLAQALSWPDVYREPEVMDAGAWYAYRDDDGEEWAEFIWNVPVTSDRIVVVEAGQVGAIKAVDEIRDVHSNALGAKKYVRLWEGRLTPGSGTRFTLFHLSETRSLTGLRLVLDTASVPGRNRIDGIGLLEPGPEK